MFVRLVVYKITKKPVWYKKNPTEIAFGFRVVALCFLSFPTMEQRRRRTRRRRRTS